MKLDEVPENELKISNISIRVDRNIWGIYFILTILAEWEFDHAWWKAIDEVYDGPSVPRTCQKHWNASTKHDRLLDIGLRWAGDCKPGGRYPYHRWGRIIGQSNLGLGVTVQDVPRTRFSWVLGGTNCVPCYADLSHSVSIKSLPCSKLYHTCRHTRVMIGIGDFLTNLI